MRNSIPAVLLACLISSPATADTPSQEEPAGTLEGFCTTLRDTLASEPEDQSLQSAFGQVQQYWIAPTPDQVRQTGRVANLEAVMLFRLRRPDSCAIENLRVAGDFASATLVLTPTAQSGVVRDEDYAPVEAEVKLIRQEQQWYLVDFVGPPSPEPPKPPTPQQATAEDSPAQVAGKFMDAVIRTLGPGGNVNVSQLAAETEDLWVSDRETRRTMGMMIPALSVMKPSSWTLEAEDIRVSQAEVGVAIQTTVAAFTVFPAKPDAQGVLRLTLLLNSEDGRWLLRGYQP